MPAPDSGGGVEHSDSVQAQHLLGKQVDPLNRERRHEILDSSDLSWAAPVFWATTEQGEPVADASPSVVQSPTLDDNRAVVDLDREIVDHPIKKPSEPAASKHDIFVHQMNQFQ